MAILLHIMICVTKKYSKITYEIKMNICESHLLLFSHLTRMIFENNANMLVLSKNKIKYLVLFK